MSNHLRMMSCSAITIFAAMSCAALADPAPRVEDGHLFEPPSNSALTGLAERHAHTFIRVKTPIVGPKNHPNPNYVGGPPASGYYIETPASLQCIYGFVAAQSGCNPNQVTALTSGGSKTIAIVDAYDYPNASADLTTFSSQFGLPLPTAANFTRINLGSYGGSANKTGWDLEAALDIEYAHAMAPNAKLILVEAASNSERDLFNAVTYAANLVSKAGGGEVSMSWGQTEFSGEQAFDNFMIAPNVVFYAASGDASGTQYPCMSPNVVCVGGTSHSRNAQTFAFEAQWPWSEEGGGISSYELAPAFQAKLAGSNGFRMAPDVSAIADPNNAVWVFNSTYYRTPTWFNVGGTSAATPITAALDNAAGNFQTSSLQYLTYLYGDAAGIARSDLTSGYCGSAYGFVAGAGWDICAGWGTPKPHVLP